MNNRLVYFLIIFVSFGLIIGAAEAGTNIIEFKKKHEINSPKVCGDKLCDEIEDERISEITRKNRHTPLGQYNQGIPIHKITCKPDLVFVIKLTNWHPACIKPENVQRLVDIGWAASPEVFENILIASTKKEIPQFAPLKEYRKEFPLYEGLGLSIEPDTINGEAYLIFDGYGWHRFHNVEITLSDESGVVEFLMSQTDPRGDLYMPWRIPDTISSGMYHVFASDGINEFELDVPISSSIAEPEKTILTLHKFRHSGFDEGQIITFTGKLTDESGKRIPNANIIIKNDGPCPSDRILAQGITDKYGKFVIRTITQIWDESDNLVKAHAEYSGNAKLLPSVSDEIIVVVYPLAGEKCDY